VRDGETVALGGLIRESRSGGGSGLPYLRRIPALGQLFGSTQRDMRRTELIVLITPRVMRSDTEVDDAMQDLRDRFRALKNVPTEWRALDAAAIAKEAEELKLEKAAGESK
jgi:general secretion pathway protein D